MRILKQATLINLFGLVRVYGFVLIKKPFHVVRTDIYIPIKEGRIQSTNLNMSANKNKKVNVDYIKREEWAQDLVSLGGDPSFLPEGFSDEDEWYEDDAIDENNESSMEMPSMSLLGVAGSPSVVAGKMEDDEEVEEFTTTENENDFEWDGTENEDAYYD